MKIKLDDELKEKILDWDYKIVNEDPLVIKDEFGNTYKGLVTQLIIDEVLDELKEDDEDYNMSINDAIERCADNQKLLLTADFNYADEFDLTEWIILDSNETKELVENVQNYDDTIYFGFGTNQELRYTNGQEMLNEITVRLISEEEADIIQDVMESVNSDHNFFNTLFEIIEEDEEDDEEEDKERTFSKSEIKMVEYLKTQNFNVSILKIDNTKLHVENGELVSIIPFYELNFLYKIVKNQNKNK